MKILVCFLFLCASAFSQTPLYQWKADALSLANNDPVATWASSASANNAAQSTSGKRPVYKTGPARVSFDGSDDYLKLTTALTPTDCTIYVVFAPAAPVATSDAQALFGRESGTQPYGTVYLGNASSTLFTNEILSWVRFENAGSNVYGSASIAALSGLHIWSFRLSGSTAEIRRDGATVSTTTSTDGSLNASTRPFTNVDIIGALNSASSPFAGDIYEIQFYDSALSIADQRTTFAALATKYGFTVPSIIAASVSTADVQAAVNAAFDGDTVTIPPGEESWTSGVSIEKAISVIGSTTVDSDAGTANDQTIIQDDLADNARAFVLSAPQVGQTARLSGITFTTGARVDLNTAGIATIAGHGEDSGKVRLDNCNFSNLNQGYALKVFSEYGVIDHCLFHNSGLQSIHLTGEGFDNNGVGDPPWADFPWFGTDKFMFIEDNYFFTNDPVETVHCIDGDLGMRWVIRHNHFYDTQTQTHGTEDRKRGVRATEVYENDFHWSHSIAGMGGARTGSHLFHDNTIEGTRPDNWLTLTDLRQTNRFEPDTTTSFGGADGENPWDVNDITNGTVTPGQTLTASVDISPLTFVNGAFTYTSVVNGLYLSSTASAPNTDSTHVYVSGASWTTDMWKGFAVKRPSDAKFTVVQSNTSDTLTVYYFEQSGIPITPDWTAGNAFEIRRPLVMLDHPGRGKANAISGGWSQAPPVIESGSGSQAWPDQVQEPVYNWNNIYNSSETFTTGGYGIADPMSFVLKAGRDYYNDADGASSSAVIAKYTAALNGSDYTGPYIYPHPLNVAEPLAVSGSTTVSGSGVTSVNGSGSTSIAQ